MREIKFRAWDENLKKMFVVANIDFRYPKPLVLNNDEPNYVNKITGQFPLMQFTGLKDKNGKEIYEGDVVSLPTLKNPAPVVIEPHGTGLRELNGTWQGQLSHRTAEAEVIGNICENPELIEKP